MREGTPAWQSPVKCLETRKRDGITHRRYQLADGRRVSTVEIPATVLRRFNAKQVEEALATFERGEALRVRSVKMKQLIAEGVKPTAIAHELGVTEEAVRITRRNMKAEK